MKALMAWVTAPWQPKIPLQTPGLPKVQPHGPIHMKQLAMAELEQRNYGNAVRFLTETLQLAPLDEEARLLLARAFLSWGKKERATELLGEILKKAPQTPATQLIFASLLTETLGEQQAIPFFDELVRTQPSNTIYRARRAQLFFNLGRNSEAIADWEIIGPTAMRDPETIVQLGSAYLRVNDFKGVDRAITFMNAADPANPVFLRFRASVEVQRGNYELAVLLVRQVLNQRPEDRDCLLILARALTNLRRETEALEILQALVRSRKDNAATWFQLASLCLYMNRIDEALRYYDKLVKTDPSNIAWQRERAETLYQTGRYEAAVAEWTSLASRNPPDARSIQRLADDAYYRGAWKEFLRRAKHLSGLQELEEINTQRIATAHMQLGHSRRAIRAIDKLIASQPLSLDAHFMKADFLETQHRWRPAKKIYRRILRSNPSSRKALDGLARIAAEQRRYRESFRYQRILMEDAPSLWTYPYWTLREAGWLAESGRTRDAMALIKEFTRERPVVIRSLLYHGISPVNRADQISVEEFRSQLWALKKAGYNSITMAQLDAHFRLGKPLPDKPILITFDDARADAFRNGDPVLKETGFKATMFVPYAALAKYPFHAGAGDLQNWQSTGRWEMQSHSNEGHGTVKIDRKGTRGRFFANRRWLDDQNRLETLKEFEVRIDRDFRTAKELLSKDFPGTKMSAFAYPFGDYGQIGSINTPQAAAINQKLVQKHHNFVFIQDPYGANTAASMPFELTRFEVPKGMSGAGLVSHLSQEDPWLKGKLFEAALWERAGMPLKSLKVIEGLENNGIVDSELLVQKAASSRILGQDHRARELYARAAELDPETARYRRLSLSSRLPTLSSRVEGFSDSANRNNSKKSFRLGVPLGRTQISGLMGRSGYSESGVPGITGSEGGLEISYTPFSFANTKVSYVRQSFSGRSRAGTIYGGEVAIVLLPELTLRLDGDRNNVDSVRAITAGIKQDTRGASLDWRLFPNTRLSFRGDAISYSDGNLQRNFRFEALRDLTRRMGVGYSFWHGDSAQASPLYWTPRGLRRHMGLLSLKESIGPFQGGVRYGRGLGYEAARASALFEFVSAQIDWRIADYLFFNTSANYNRSPLYSSRRLNFGLSLNY